MIYEVPCGMHNACRIYLDYLYSNCNQVSPALKDQEKKLTEIKLQNIRVQIQLQKHTKNAKLINKLLTQYFKMIQCILLAGDVFPLSELADSSELLGSTNSTSK